MRGRKAKTCGRMESTMNIRYGVCTGFENLGEVARAGYDYMEANLTQLAMMSSEEFSRIADLVDAEQIKVEAYNCFFPGDFALVGERFDLNRIKLYVEKALARAARLGGKICVLGSGGARNIPDGFDRTVAEEQFIEVLRACGDLAKYHRMTVVIEPLNAGETNLANTVSEGLKLAARAAHPNVACLADFFHVLKSGESLEAIESSGGALRHLHIADPERHFAELKCHPELLNAWADALRACSYSGRLSLEGHFEDFSTDIKSTIKLLKEYFN